MPRLRSAQNPRYLERSVPSNDGALERRLRKLCQEVLTLDPARLSLSTRAEAKRLVEALRPLVSKITPRPEAGLRRTAKDPNTPGGWPDGTPGNTNAG